MDIKTIQSNEKSLDVVRALIEKTGWGVLRVDFLLHNKKIVKMTVYGEKKLKYSGD